MKIKIFSQHGKMYSSLKIFHSSHPIQSMLKFTDGMNIIRFPAFEVSQSYRLFTTSFTLSFWIKIGDGVNYGPLFKRTSTGVFILINLSPNSHKRNSLVWILLLLNFKMIKQLSHLFLHHRQVAMPYNQMILFPQILGLNSAYPSQSRITGELPTGQFTLMMPSKIMFLPH